MNNKSENKQIWRSIDEATINLIQRILSHKNSFSRLSSKDKRQVVLSQLTHRILRNLVGINILVKKSSEHENSVFLKLPIGLIVRNCLMDCILAIYISEKDQDSCEKLILICNHDYIKALFEEYEVYKDKLSGVDDTDDQFGKHMYTLALEDTYLNDFSINEDFKSDSSWCEINMWKTKDYKELYDGCKKADSGIKNIKDKALEQGNHTELVQSLYAYYKYFSQYEHFSQRGNGDSLADFGEDNIKFEKVFTHINSTLTLVFQQVNKVNLE